MIRGKRMPFLKIQNLKLKIEDICDFLSSDVDFDMFIQIEMKDCSYHKIEYKKKDLETFKNDLEKVEKILIKACNIRNYNERKINCDLLKKRKK
jgi:hypothetical protein